MADTMQAGRQEPFMQTIRAFLYLLACAVNGAVPDESVMAKADFEGLAAISGRHHMDASLYFAMQAYADFGSGQTEAFRAHLPKYRDSYAANLKRSILLDAERQKILAHLEESGIWYCPMKGAYINGLYPHAGMRIVSDVDILFDAAAEQQVDAYMQERGYTPGHKEGTNNEYLKAPLYNIEMHKALISPENNASVYAYYKDVKERLTKDEGNAFGYHFSDEAFYVHSIVNSWKDYSSTGTGVRSLLDNYVFRKSRGQAAVFGAAGQALQETGLEAYEEKLRILSDKLFAQPADPQYLAWVLEGAESGAKGGSAKGYLTDAERKFLAEFTDSGIYGNAANIVRHNLERSASGGGKKSKLKYVLRSIFPDKDTLLWVEPAAARHKYVWPVFYLVRAVKVARRMLFNKEYRSKKQREYDILRKL